MAKAMAKKSFIIAGPTASGKSDFAHNIAKLVGGTIINSDSVQIYAGIENISASPFAGRTSEVMPDGAVIDGVPYKLFSVRKLDDQISVAGYLEMARAEYEKAEVPIFVGGSGYYVNTLINGLSPVPEVSAENRDRARKMIAEAPRAAMELTDFEFRDPQRMARALEVFLETGRPLKEWQSLPRRGAVAPDATRILIFPPKDILADRIRARLPQMLDGGGMDEIRKNIDLPQSAIGIEEVGKVLRGEAPMDQALENWALRTEQYAKRQRTWFRNKYNADITIYRVPAAEDLENIRNL
jgi:tRNA dimethylallyltransferase